METFQMTPATNKKAPQQRGSMLALLGLSNNQQHRIPRLRQTHHQHLGGVLIAHVQTP